MTELVVAGFDEYGPAGILGTANQTLMQLLGQDGWSYNPTFSTSPSIVAPLSGYGQAVQINAALYTDGLLKTFTSNYSTLISGVRFSATSTSYSWVGALAFQSSGGVNCSIRINNNGTVSLMSGSTNGTVIATSTYATATSGTHYLETQITFGASAAYAIWIDGILILTGTGNTGNGNTTANQVKLGTTYFEGNVNNIIFDDFYCFNTAGTTNNAPLLSNPVVDTKLPSSDSSVQFTIGANVLGTAYYTTANTNAPGANELFLRLVTPSANCTLNSISCLPQATSGTANFESVVYSTTGSVPGTLLGIGNAIVGATTATILTSYLSSNVSLTGGTQYAIGFITDTSVNLQQSDTATTGQKAANTYTSGAPNTAPTMTTAQADWMIWGSIGGLSTNYTEENNNPNLGSLAYVYSNVATTTDRYNFSGFSGFPVAIYTVEMAAAVNLTSTGTRTVSLQVDSSGNISAGSSSNITPTVGSYSYLSSFYPTDPATGNAWTVSGISAATAGLIIAS